MSVTVVPITEQMPRVPRSLISAPTDRVDPLLAYKPLPFVTEVHPFGFGISLQSNNSDLLAIARSSWPLPGGSLTPTSIRIVIGVQDGNETECPAAPTLRAQEHLLTMLCGAESFITCDLRAGYAFGWISAALLLHPEFVRYHLLDAAIMILLASSYLTPLHAACVSYNGRGILLQGPSGAGKSTLAYACARAGWTYTTDDASLLLRDGDDLLVRGRCGQIRFRPSARELFTELEGRSVTPRMAGKPSMEVPTETLPSITTAAEAQIYALVALERGPHRRTRLTALSPSDGMRSLEESLFPLPFVRELQRPTLEKLARTKMFTLQYQELEPAIQALEALAKGKHE